MKAYGDLDSKFRFVILASKRAKQLLDGAKPKIKTKSKNLIQVAQKEVKQRLIDYEIVQPKEEDFHRNEDEAFIGEELELAEEGVLKKEAPEKEKDQAKEPPKKKASPDKKPKKTSKTKTTKTTKKKSSKKEG